MFISFSSESTLIQVLVLLVVGHVFSDFLIQTPYVALNKGRRNSVLIRHGFLTFLVQSLVLFPFFSAKLTLLIVLLAVMHTLIDFGKRLIQVHVRSHLNVFFIDQSLHMLSLLILWSLIRVTIPEPTLVFLDQGSTSTFVGIAILLAGYVFNGKGGNTVVQGVLHQFPSLLPSRSIQCEQYSMGKTIGTLERYLLLTLVLVNQWTALGLVVAVRAIGMSKDFEWQTIGYYRMGTLASWLIAVLSGITISFLLAL